MISHTARQWAVGHGGFCTAEIRSGYDAGLRPIRYVYDCGAMRPRHLYQAIPAYLAEVAADSGAIDLVVLSHIDLDHVNGLKRLLTDSQVRVDRVMLPYLSPAERLLAIARSVAAIEGEDGMDPDDPDDDHDGGALAPDGFELHLMLDPTTALRGLDPDVQVIFVHGSEGDDDAGLGPDPAPVEDFRVLLRPPEEPGDLGMIAVGPGWAKHDPETGESHMSDRIAVRVHESTKFTMWLLAPYVSARRRDRVAAFMAAAAATFDLSEHELRNQLSEPGTAYTLVVQHRGRLRDLYKQFGGTNASSMCLYSGPLASGGPASSEILDGDGISLTHSDRAGTLLTGDAELKRQDDVDALVAHYAPLVPLMDVVHLPHHGSWHNISAQLLETLPNLRLAIGMTNPTSPHHPGPETMHAVAARGVKAHLVTNEPASALVTLATAT
ncbi:MBL fold metallo-hydrolase [Ornithinimicrobium sufpigmenti]|uniref:MBL fold metallo-hydrolase n=1 Tax=Ornithinimicrobium sufpigmenti TaxID=2508882 RepID=UPI001036532A|nr:MULTISPECIES: MBL fold metallo-hydrolase [unclassified Ornithinimicrobium]